MHNLKYFKLFEYYDFIFYSIYYLFDDFPVFKIHIALIFNHKSITLISLCLMFFIQLFKIVFWDILLEV